MFDCDGYDTALRVTQKGSARPEQGLSVRNTGDANPASRNLHERTRDDIHVIRHAPLGIVMSIQLAPDVAAGPQFCIHVPIYVPIYVAERRRSFRVVRAAPHA